MSGRKRTVQIKFRVTEEERALIEQKMKLVPTRNIEEIKGVLAEIWRLQRLNLLKAR